MRELRADDLGRHNVRLDRLVIHLHDVECRAFDDALWVHEQRATRVHHRRHVGHSDVFGLPYARIQEAGGETGVGHGVDLVPVVLVALDVERLVRREQLPGMVPRPQVPFVVSYLDAVVHLRFAQHVDGVENLLLGLLRTHDAGHVGADIVHVPEGIEISVNRNIVEPCSGALEQR